MKKEDVPQQGGLNAGCREVNYAVDGDGRYTLESSVGWEAKNIALRQAWEAIVEQLRETLAEIKAGKKSALAYYMAKNQMDPALLAQYSGVARWRVKRHLKPSVFAKLSDAVLTPYAELFGISVATLRTVPETPDLLLAELDHAEDVNL
ncbi:MAG: hypothetical protein P1P74_09135 [Desulfuromonadales bacterium]|nr:hypothetical protein [Desulfuromonadales bacterium]MDT8423981.1 hypothetical protein [Desulfuromonadales bacterium]